MVSYYLDADSTKAYWASESPALDAWKRQFFPRPTLGKFPEFYPASWRVRMKNTASVLPLPAPTAEVLSDSTNATARTLRLQLRSPRGGSGFEIGLIAPNTADVRALRINDVPVTPSRAPVPGGHQFFIECYGLPLNKTITLTIQARPGVPLRLLLYDESLTLPAALIRAPRPADVVFEQGKGSNQTVVRKSFRF